MPAVLAQHAGKVVAHGVRVTEGRAVGAREDDGRLLLVLLRGCVLYIIGREAVEAVVLVVVGVVSELRLEAEVLEDFPGEAACHVECGATLATVGVADGLQGVVEVEARVGLTACHRCVGESLHGERRVNHGVLQAGVARRGGALLVHAAAVHLALGIADGEVEVDVLDRIHVELETEVVADEVGHLHDGFVVDVCVVERELHLLRAACYAQAVIERVARATEDDVLPVVRLDIVVEVDVLPVAEVLAVLLGIDFIGLRLVVQHRQLVLPACVVAGAHDVKAVRQLLKGDVGVVIHADFPLLAALCRDDDDAVGSARTIDGSRGRILQHGDVLDVGSRDVADGLDGESVDNEQRVVALRDGAATADSDLHFRIGRTFRRGNLHAGELALHRLDGGSHRNAHQRLCVDRGNGPGDVLLFHRAVSDYDHLFKVLCVLAQDYVQWSIFTLLHGDFLGQVPDVRKDEHTPRGHVRELEVAVEIRYGAGLGTLHLYADANQRLARRVRHRTRHVLPLCESEQADEPHQQGHCPSSCMNILVHHKQNLFLDIRLYVL